MSAELHTHAPVVGSSIMRVIYYMWAFIQTRNLLTFEKENQLEAPNYASDCFYDKLEFLACIAIQLSSHLCIIHIIHKSFHLHPSFALRNGMSGTTCSLCVLMILLIAIDAP